MERVLFNSSWQAIIGMILCLPIFYSVSTFSTVQKDVEKELWHVKAIAPDGKFLDVKAIDKNGDIFAVKALEINAYSHY